MRVYFIGAGPGAADLITVRGARLLSQVPIVVYAGSLVPKAVLEHCSQSAEIINSAPLNLDEQTAIYARARASNQDVCRVHSGDPSIYGALAEQMRRLQALDIEYEVVPGVSSYSAAAAQLKVELTKPNLSQTVILTRVSGKATPVPELESLELLAAHKCTLCIFLSGPHLKAIVEELLNHYAPDTPIALVCRATWPTERRHVSTLDKILVEVDPAAWSLTTMLLVGEVLRADSGDDSCLYASEFEHRFRSATSTGQK